MTDQTPDPWKTVFMRTAGTCVPGMWVYPADEVSEALAAERAQHQQEIANRVREVEHWVTRYNELEQWRVQQSVTLARRDEMIRQLQTEVEHWREARRNAMDGAEILKGQIVALKADRERTR